MKIEFFPIDYDYFDYEGRTYARITARTNEKKRAVIIDSCDVYFYLILKEDVKAKRIDAIRRKIETIRN